MANGWMVEKGYRGAPDSAKQRIQTVYHCRKRIWVLSCSAENDNQDDSPLDKQVPLSEQVYLVFCLQLHLVQAMWQQATKRFRTK